MPATTDNLNIPYPVSGDKVADYPALARQAAEKTEELLTTTSTAQPQAGWKQIQNTGALQRIGSHVFFDGIGLAKPFNYEAGALNEFGKIIPNGFIPSSEVCAAGAVIQNWRAYPCLIGIRDTGTLYAIAQLKVYVAKADIYNYLLVPAMSWQVAS